MNSSSHLRWLLFIFGVLFLLAGLVSVTQGSGVQHRLDAREGLKSQAFQTSLQRAMTRMTRAQIEAYNWAVSGLDTESLVGRYGANPSVREVIVGQVARYLDEKRKRAALLEAELQKTPELVEAGWRSRREALDLFRTYQPEVIRVVFEDLEGSAERKKGRVLYRVLNPNDLQLKSLPCRMVWWGNAASGQQSQDFDCLAQKRATTGEYYVSIPSVQIIQVESVRIELVKCGPNVLSGCWGVLALAKEVLPELVELWRLREEMRFALGYQFSL